MLEAVVDRRQLVGDAEADVAVDERRAALGVKRDEVDRRADLARREVRAAELVLVEVARELAAAAGGVGPADLRGRQGAAHAVDGVVVQLAELLAACRASSRCSASFQVSQYQVSTSAWPYFSTQCFTHWIDQLAPLGVVLRRVGPAGVDLVVLRRRASTRAGRARASTESACGMKPICTYGFTPRSQIGVEDAIDDGPVVDRVAAGVLGVGVGGAPLERRRAVAGDEQAVRAEVTSGFGASSPISAISFWPSFM